MASRNSMYRQRSMLYKRNSSVRSSWRRSTSPGSASSDSSISQVRELRQELEAAHKKTEALQNQIEEICLYMEAVPESMFEPDGEGHERAGSGSVDEHHGGHREGHGAHPGSHSESDDGGGGRPSRNRHGGSEVYPDTGLSAGEMLRNSSPRRQFGGSGVGIGAVPGIGNIGSLRGDKSALAMRVLAIRNQNVQLTQMLGERDERIRILVHESEAAKMGAQEAANSKEELGGFLHMVVADRDAALFRLKELEDSLEHLDSVERELSRLAQQPWPEPKEMLGGMLVYNPQRYAVKWHYSSPQQLAQEDPKRPYLMRKKSSNQGAAQRPAIAKTGSPSKERKESKRKHIEIFQKIFEHVQTIMSKATAAGQVATNMKVEKEFVAGAVVEIKKELLGSSQRPEDQKAGSNNKRILGEPLKRLDKDEAGRLLAAVKELRSSIEAQKKEKAGLQSYIAEKEARIAELETMVSDMQSERTNLVHVQKAISNSLGVLDLNSRELREGSILEIKKQQEQSPIVQRIIALSMERDANKSLLADAQKELEKTQRSFNDLKHILAETRSSIGDFGKEKEVLEGRNRELQQRLSEVQGTAAAVMREKENLDRQCHELQRTLSETRSSVLAMQQDQDSSLRKREELHMLLEDAKNARSSHPREPARPYDRRNMISGDSSSSADAIRRDKEMVERQLQGLQEFVTAMDAVLGLGDAVLTDNLKAALRRECGGQERLLEKLLVQRQELEAWRHEVRRERELTAAALQDMDDVINGLDHFAVRNRHPTNTRLIARVRAVVERKEQLQQVVDQSQALHDMVQEATQALRELVADESKPPLASSLFQSHPLVPVDFVRSVAELPELVRWVASLKGERERVGSQLRAVEAERDELRKKQEDVRHEQTQAVSGSQTLKDQLDAAQSLIYAPPALTPAEILKQRRISLTGTEDGETPAHPVITGIVRMKRESVLLLAKNATEEKKVHDLSRQSAALEERNHELELQLTSAEARIRELTDQVATVESWAHDFSRQATTVDSKVQDMSRQMELAQDELERLHTLVLAELDQNNSLEPYKAAKPRGRFLSEQIKEVYGKAEEVLKAKEAEYTRLKLGNENIQRRLGEQDGGGELASKVDMLMKEVLKLGGYDIFDERKRQKREGAAQRVRDFFSAIHDRGVAQRRISFQKVGQAKPSVPPSPLLKLATFQVDLLVNSKVHQSLEVGGNLGGICQAAIHYFQVNEQCDGITFENATLPGSQSSNMLVDLMLLPVDVKKAYETKAGDVLGLHIRVTPLPEQPSREVLYNNSVIHTDEVLEAIQGQPIDSFSLWPDLINSWRWERTAKNRWSLVCIRWRFLFKNIFPELSEAFQILSINNPANNQASFQKQLDQPPSRTSLGPQ